MPSLNELLIVLLFVGLPFGLLVLAIFLQWKLSTWKRLPPALRVIFLIALPVVCWLGTRYLDALNGATRQYANDFGAYFLFILFGVTFSMGVSWGSMLGLLHLLGDWVHSRQNRKSANEEPK